MTRKEKIIEILHNHSIEINADIEKWLWSGEFESVADEILSLPLDVPSDEEVDTWLRDTDFGYNMERFAKLRGAVQAIRWYKEEALTFLAQEREKIMRMTHKEALKELIKVHKIESRIKIINAISDNGLFTLK